MRHVLLFATVLTVSACPDDGRPDDLAAIPAAGITGAPGEESSTGDPEGDGPRLDLGDAPPIPDLPAEGTSTGAVDDTSTGEAETSSSSSSTGEFEGTSTGEADPGSTGEGSSTGEPEPPAVCGDGTCHASERAPCWGWKDGGGWSPSFCYEDCHADQVCIAAIDCECTAEAAAIKNFCFADPLPACSLTAPGGACEVSSALAFYMWNAKCGG